MTFQKKSQNPRHHHHRHHVTPQESLTACRTSGTPVSMSGAAPAGTGPVAAGVFYAGGDAGEVPV
ncbi:MAG: hypothetical protein WC295_06430 [Methanoregula sp.]